MFSVVIPLYNKENTISDAIKSVLDQTERDFELIVVDDGSSDSSADKVRAYDDSRLKLIAQHNQGVSTARNTGIKNAEGEYICFLDADDIWLSDHLAALSRLIKAEPGAGMYSTMHRTERYDGTVHETRINGDILRLRDYFDFALSTAGHSLSTNSICLPKVVFDKAGMFKEGERRGEDESMWLRAAAYYDAAFINEVTTVYRRVHSEVYTGAVSLNKDWSFIPYAKERLFENTDIPAKKREHIKTYVERYRLSLCRHALLEKDRTAARRYYNGLDRKYISGRDMLITRLCFFVPGALLKGMYRRRHKGAFIQW
ncbi:MAG: glycosyltransferase family 2 protein [Christensenellales bacterium]|jgi:glycosyltransferase involved in cell wall biosynthesis